MYLIIWSCEVLWQLCFHRINRIQPHFSPCDTLSYISISTKAFTVFFVDFLKLLLFFYFKNCKTFSIDVEHILLDSHK